MKILIIGSKGFIGSHCVKYLSKRHEVWECDVILDYNAPRYISIDAVDAQFYEIFQQQKFDVCINCSGAANVSFSLQKPYNDFSLNTLNVFKMLEAIRLYNKECRFITMSSAAVYGNPESLPIRENMGCAPVSPYGYHKMMMERVCEEYTRFWGIKTCCLRIFSAYGPGLKKQLLWDLYNKLQHDVTPTLWGTGEESRDFVHVDDIVRIIELSIDNSTFEAQCVNAANGRQVFIREIVKLYTENVSSNKEITFNQEKRSGDPINWEADISTVKEWGYVQKVPLEQGVKEYIAWAERELR